MPALSLFVVSNTLHTLSQYLLIAFSFKVLYQGIRFFHIAHAASLTLAAYMVYTASVLWGVSLWLAVPLAIVVVVLLMLGINQWVYRP